MPIDHTAPAPLDLLDSPPAPSRPASLRATAAARGVR